MIDRMAENDIDARNDGYETLHLSHLRIEQFPAFGDLQA